MVGAGLMLQTVARLRAIDIGFRPDHLLTLRTTLPRTKYQDRAKRIGFYHRMLEGVLALPGVQNAAYSSNPPFRTQGDTQGFRIEKRERRQAIRRCAAAGFERRLPAHTRGAAQGSSPDTGK
jgi:hypothetical protein